MMASRPLTVYCNGPDRRDVLRADPPRLSADAVYIHFAKLDELRPRAEALGSLLDAQERARAERFKFDTDRERFVLGHGWMRTLLGHYSGLPPGSIQAIRGRFGKPYLPGRELFFNLSDTKDAVVLAVSQSIELGVDLETLSRSVDHAAVGAHYFTSSEQAKIAQSHSAKRTFLDYWTRKEAVLKASGVGIMDDLRTLSVHDPVNHLTIQHAEFMAMAAENYFVRTWHVNEQHIISLATPVPVDRVLLLGA